MLNRTLEDRDWGRQAILLAAVESGLSTSVRHPKSLLRRHRSRLAKLATKKGGLWCTVRGKDDDLLAFAFRDVRSATEVVLAYENETRANDEPNVLRVALTVGKPHRFEDVVYGPIIDLCESVLTAASPGQFLATSAFVRAHRVGDALLEHFASLGPRRLADAIKPQPLWLLTSQTQPKGKVQIRDLATSPNNLPHQSTSFVGRSNDVHCIADFLQVGNVVNLLGTGGSGKTRLALQVGTELLGAFPDGVWLVKFSEWTEGCDVRAAVAQACGVKINRVEGFLRNRQVLLILDNCEHVAPEVRQFLQECLADQTQASFLLTSRHPVFPEVEQAYFVDPLPLPTTEGESSPAALMRSDAARLFIDRAHFYSQTFRLTRENTAVIAAICMRLDGLPLALELAAARLRLLSPLEVYEGLEYDLNMLARSHDLGAARHQTMSAAIEWSLALLNPAEQILLLRLSVLVGGFTIKCAQEIADHGDLPSVEMLLEQLVNKSLIVQVDSLSYDNRYRILEPIRQQARQMLLDSEPVLERLYHWAQGVVEQAKDVLLRENGAHYRRQYDMELPNLRAAFNYALEADPNGALKLAVDLFWYWSRGPQCQEGRRWVQRAMDFADPAPEMRGLAQSALGGLSMAMQEPEDALPHLIEARDLFEELGKFDRLGTVLGSLAIAYADLEMRKLAEEHHQRGIDLVRQTEGEGHRLLVGISNLAAFYRHNEPTIALRYVDEAVDLSRKLEDKWLESRNLALRSAIYTSLDRLDEARVDLLEFLRHYDQPDPRRCLSALDAASALAVAEGDPKRAQHWLNLSARLRSDLGFSAGSGTSNREMILRKRIAEQLGGRRLGRTPTRGAVNLDREMVHLGRWLNAQPVLDDRGPFIS